MDVKTDKWDPEAFARKHGRVALWTARIFAMPPALAVIGIMICTVFGLVALLLAAAAPGILLTGIPALAHHARRHRRHMRWLAWLAKDAPGEGFTPRQRGTAIRTKPPEHFFEPPSAEHGGGGTMCLTWREPPWTLSVEIATDGSDEWWAYNTETKETVTGREAIAAKFAQPAVAS